MKRCLESAKESDNGPTRKVSLVEVGSNPGGVTLVNPNRVSKNTYAELMDLAECSDLAESFTKANSVNKLEMIGRQMKNLESLMGDIVRERNLDNELNSAACNFVKKPGHIYHLYERPTGQRYLGMISPEEWANAPHEFLGSFRLGIDHSWTPVGEESIKHEGVNYLRKKYAGSSGLMSLTMK